MKYKYIFDEGDKEFLSNLPEEYKTCIDCKDKNDKCWICRHKDLKKINKEIKKRNLEGIVDKIVHLYRIQEDINILKLNATFILNQYDEETKEVIDLALCNMCDIKK